jgi:hypothetical protein
VVIVLLDTGPAQLPLVSDELGAGIDIGQLLTPLTRYTRRQDTFAIDNGAFAGFNATAFKSLLKREWDHRNRCLFVTVPDVVGSARRTLEVFDHWYPKLHGWPLALACQNGQEQQPIRWDLIACAFIGGDDEFKDGPHAAAIVKAAMAMDKHVHIGRLNGVERAKRFVDLCGDYPKVSIDGSGISQYSHMRVKLGRAIRGDDEEPKLFSEGEAA